MSAGAALDVLLLLVLLGYAVSGARRGLFVGAVSLLGFVIGVVAAALVLPGLVEQLAAGPLRALVVLGGTLLAGVLLQSLLTALALLVRRRVTWEPARAVDAVAGVVGGVLAAAFVVWVAAGAVLEAPLPVVARAVAGSQVVRSLETVAPTGARETFASYYAAVSGELFPRVFLDGVPQPVRAVPEPDPGAAVTEGVQAAAAGVVRVAGVAEACGRGQEGSGFVVGPGRVVTNAHVVAGMAEPSVQVGGAGEVRQASVVVFDPVRDLAVLDVPGLEAEPLLQGPRPESGSGVAVAGFPLAGQYTVSAGRVRDSVRAVGEDIYGAPGAEREIWSLLVTVRPGNSGGPVLDPSGAVVGVVFARSLDDAATGYALTLEEARPVFDVALTAQGPVDNQVCAAVG